jgi:hypothetical protein
MRLGAVFFCTLALSGCLALTTHDGPWRCNVDSDCDAPQVCHNLTGSDFRCVDPLACHASDDCARFHGTGWLCTDGACVAPGCLDDSTCGAYACVQYQCATTCSFDSECSAGNYCLDGGVCGPKACSIGKSGQCGGFACSTGSCPTSCADDSGCEPGSHCDLTGRPTCSRCVGTPTPCSQLAGCTVVPECSRSHVCGPSGATFDCSLFDYDSFQCAQTAGCTYDDWTSKCSGTTQKCTDQGYDFCFHIRACTPDVICVGTRTPCSQLSLSACYDTAGCTVE